MSKKQKMTLIRIIVSGVLWLAAILIPVEGLWKLLLFLVPYGIIAWDVLWRAIRNIAHGPVSYTHLDVYKRQPMPSIRPLPCMKL